MIRVFAFLVAVAFGVVPLSISYNSGASVYIQLENQEEQLHFDDTIILRCYTDGIYEPYFICWQYMDPDEERAEWRSLNCASDIYEFVLTPENMNYCYRVIVTCDDEKNLATQTDLSE